MPGSPAYLAFVISAFVLLIIPGPAVLFIVAQSLSQGRKVGVVSALGTTAGSLFHVAAAAIGLSAIIVASPAAFTVIKILGAVYLVYLGVRAMSRQEAANVQVIVPRKPRRVFADGVLVAVLNPKTALFFLAFLPQFTDRSRGSVTTQIVTLGLTFSAMALCTDTAFALLAGTVRDRLGTRGGAPAWTRYVSGAIYLSLGIGTALMGGLRHS